MATIAVSGTSRGIGLELVKQLVDLPHAQVSKVFALSRGKPTDALQALIDKHIDRVTHTSAAVDDDASVQQAAKTVESHLGDRGLDILVNNAGIAPWNTSGKMGTLPVELLTRSFEVNVVGTHRVTSAFLPLLEKGKMKLVVNMGTTLASITWAERYAFAPTQAYNISKTALNMMNKQYAMSYADQGFTFVCVSPGISSQSQLRSFLTSQVITDRTAVAQN
ncbi:hypothetical protein BAUCODRAFT_37950 [Baudoinia panamericana UAMH 10762]|uniref:NAD(P)-binding protein n=1 Tax=Baudoinia panamericana (strain UAMH 10762) TaxID=717646 RepID=M2LG71_BAUPA|nr:uncharacterized protein BAUCODRAFT_37950 [Baudoinia panamericana UAMH 10762]EMC93027.1 hypothetical protein BAUCODRAFT_37950 [Baudoinia panamericana UAMH 10762]